MATSSTTGNYPDVVQANDANDAAVIDTGHTVTLTGNVTGNNYFKINSGGTLVGAGYSITVDNDSSDWSFLNEGTISGVLDVIITNPNGVAKLNFNGQAGNVRNLTINHASCVATLEDENQTLDGNLIIEEGTLTTLDSDGTSSRDLTCGDITVENGGTLTGNASAITCESLTVESGGTYNATSGITKLTAGSSSHSPQPLHTTAGTMYHNNGTVFYNGKGGNSLRWSAGHIYNLDMLPSGSTGSGITLQGDASSKVTIDGDFTIENGSGNGILLVLGGASYDLEVGGNMYMRTNYPTASENVRFYNGADPTGNWRIHGTLKLSGNEHVYFRAPTSAGSLKVGGFINEGAYFQST